MDDPSDESWGKRRGMDSGRAHTSVLKKITETPVWRSLYHSSMTLLIGDEWLKHLVMRSRPCFDYPWVSLAIATPGPHDYSFPSGHAFASFAAAAAMSPSLPVYGRVAVFTLAVLIAFSRIYLFVHYPTDVLGGAVLGIACGMAAWYTVKISYRKKRLA